MYKLIEEDQEVQKVFVVDKNNLILFSKNIYL